MNFIDVFQEIFLKNNGNKYSHLNIYLVNSIYYADDNFFNKKEMDNKQRASQEYLALVTKFLVDNKVSDDCIQACKKAILDAVDYLRPIEVS